STAASANAPGPDVVIVAAARLTCELAPSATTPLAPKPVAEETPVVTVVGPVALMTPPRSATRPDAPAPPVEIDTPEMVVVPPVEATKPSASAPCVEILVPVKPALVPESSVNTPMAPRPVVATEPPVTVVAPPLLVKTPNASEPVVTMVESVSFNAPPPTVAMPFVPLYTPGEPNPVVGSAVPVVATVTPESVSWDPVPASATPPEALPYVEILVPVKLALVPESSVNTPMARRPVVVTEPPVTVVTPPLLVKTPNASEPVVTMVESVSFNAPPAPPTVVRSVVHARGAEPGRGASFSRGRNGDAGKRELGPRSSQRHATRAVAVRRDPRSRETGARSRVFSQYAKGAQARGGHRAASDRGCAAAVGENPERIGAGREDGGVSQLHRAAARAIVGAVGEEAVAQILSAARRDAGACRCQRCAQAGHNQAG